MWISKYRFEELKEKCKELEEKCDRIERILNFSIDGKITYTFNPLDPSKCNVYIDKKEYSFNIPSYLRIYDLEKIDGQDEIIKIKCFGDFSARKCYLVDLKSGEKIEINSEDMKI